MDCANDEVKDRETEYFHHERIHCRDAECLASIRQSDYKIYMTSLTLFVKEENHLAGV